MNTIKRLTFFGLLLLLPALLFAQKPAFWNDIQQFKKQDSLKQPEKGQILLIGSSSFTMWKDVDQYFPGYKILNRGFGGSTLLDVIRYADEIIFPYDPKQVIIYCGENDLAGPDSISAQSVTHRFRTLFTIIRNKYPKIPIVFISIKPSPSRAHLLERMKESNKMIEKFLDKKKNTVFVDVYKEMLKDGKPREELFIEDRLHMNAKGYAIWKKLLEPHLSK